MKEWLRKTHAPGFELLRHFLRRFFDNDLITTPGQMTKMLIGVTPVFFQWFFLLVLPLRQKYAYLSSLPEPDLYREAVQADELWLITLMMSAIGLLTAIKWQSLFPDLRDYRALAALPLRSWQIFAAKLAALLLVGMAALITLNFLPSVLFPAVSASHWAIHSSLGANVGAHAGASLAAGAFFFFTLIALQGVLLNLLRPRAFGCVTGYLQGCLVAIMLGLVVLSFSIQPHIASVIVRPEWSRWLPPVWFLGLFRALSGDPDPAMHALAQRALAGLTVALSLALLSHLVSYHRHRTLLVEGAAGPARNGYLGGRLLDRLVSDPREEAILGFMMKSLMRSSYHRMIMMGYGGLGFAVLLTGFIGAPRFAEPARVVTAGFVYYHILALLFLLIGARHLFSRPTELKANWIFEITEGEGRLAWLTAVDRFVLLWGAVLMLIPFPLEAWLLGWRSLAEVALSLVLGLLSYEWVFLSWEKLPFTCSHLPGKTPIGMVLAFFGLIAAVSLLHRLLLSILSNRLVTVIAMAVLLALWTSIHRVRRHSWTDLHLKYEEVPDPAVYGLNLLK